MAPAGDMAPAGGAASAIGGEWDVVLPLNVLRDELAAVQNDLRQTLLTVSSYNANFEAAERDGWEASALATIAAEYSGPISWKQNALLARDAGVAVAMAATARGRKNQGETQVAFDQFSGVLNNNPPKLPPPDPSASREETASRAALMKRMQIAQARLKDASADDAALKAAAETAPHEAAILAALMKFTAHPDYGSAAEPEYQQFAGC